MPDGRFVSYDYDGSGKLSSVTSDDGTVVARFAWSAACTPATRPTPELGGFLPPDPIGQTDHVNLYLYAQNRPLNLVDPTGTVRVAGAINRVLDSVPGPRPLGVDGLAGVLVQATAPGQVGVRAEAANGVGTVKILAGPIQIDGFEPRDRSSVGFPGGRIDLSGRTDLHYEPVVPVAVVPPPTAVQMDCRGSEPDTRASGPGHQNRRSGRTPDSLARSP